MKLRCLRVLMMFLGTVGLMASSSTFAQDELFVANRFSDSITVYSKSAGINAAPLRIISGAATKLSRPTGVAVDAVNNEIVVTNEGDNVNPDSASITVYARDANGNVAPLRAIAGDASGLDTQGSSPGGGVAVDPLYDEIFATTTWGLVRVWNRTANGNEAPLRSFGGSWRMDYLGGLVLDTINNELIVAQYEALLFFPRNATGDALPQRIIGGNLADIVYGAGVALDSANDEVAVASSGNGTVKVFARNASGNVAPLRTIVAGSTTIYGQPHGIAIDPVHNELVVSNSKYGSITVFDRTANGDVAPLRIVAGPATGLNGYIALALPSVTSLDYVQRVYVAYYGRPADPAGQDYWAARMDIAGHSLDPIIAEFGNSDEFNRRYGGLGYPALVIKIYQQALGRNPDQDGLNYYVGELIAGHRTLQTIALDVLNGATTTLDSIVVVNKLDVAAHYTKLVRSGCLYGAEQDGVNIVAAVTANSATVDTAKAAINSRCGF